MSDEKITCRIAVQICVGYFPDGRERRRTFSLWHVRPDVTPEAIRDIIRALAPLLEYPITKVTKVTKRVIFSADEERNAPDAAPRAATPTPRVNAAPVAESESGKIIPFPVFPVIERPAAQRAIGHDIAERSSCASPRQKRFMPGRSPPKFYFDRVLMPVSPLAHRLIRTAPARTYPSSNFP